MMRTCFSIAVLLGLGVFVPAHVAFAGFEFLPATSAPHAMAEPAQPAAPPIPIAPMMPQPAMAAPAMPVAREPLAPSAPQPVFNSPAPIYNVPVATPRGGLIINPYPLGPSTKAYNLADISSGSVNRAMIEESGLVTPMPLGHHMRTGAQVENPPRRIARKPDTPEMASRGNSGNREPSSLTPIPGAPIPIEQQRLPSNAYPEAVGFGTDIPLSIALMQVIPEGYQAQLPDASLEEAIVSWEGGKPWNQVLNDVLRPLGYAASIQGNRVMIEPYLRG